MASSIGSRRASELTIEQFAQLLFRAVLAANPLYENTMHETIWREATEYTDDFIEWIEEQEEGLPKGIKA